MKKLLPILTLCICGCHTSKYISKEEIIGVIDSQTAASPHSNHSYSGRSVNLYYMGWEDGLNNVKHHLKKR